jgi:hypothetical protein
LPIPSEKTRLVKPSEEGLKSRTLLRDVKIRSREGEEVLNLIFELLIFIEGGQTDGSLFVSQASDDSIDQICMG